MILTALGAFVLGWALLLVGSAAGLPMPGWALSNTPLAHGVAVLLGFTAAQALRRTNIGQLAEGKAYRLFFRAFWTIGDPPK